MSGMGRCQYRQSSLSKMAITLAHQPKPAHMSRGRLPDHDLGVTWSGPASQHFSLCKVASVARLRNNGTGMGQRNSVLPSRRLD